MEKEAKDITRLKLQDIQTFESLFNSYYQPLTGYARTIIKDTDAAEDIVQQVFVSLWEKREVIEIHTSFKAMLYKAVYNACMNKIKHETVKRNYSKEILFTVNTTFSEEGIQYKELQKMIQDGIEKLPEQCAKIFKMSRYEYLKYQEIADQLNLSIKTVENQMGKALKILRENMKDFLLFILALIIIK